MPKEVTVQRQTFRTHTFKIPDGVEEGTQEWDDIINDYNWNNSSIEHAEETVLQISPRYDYAFDVAFSLQSDKKLDDLTKEELLAALKKRVSDLENNPDEIMEACSCYLVDEEG